MWISKKQWKILEKRMDDLERKIQIQEAATSKIEMKKRQQKLEIKPDDPLHRTKDYLSLAILFQTSVDRAKDNYDIFVQQCREAGII